MKTQEEIDIFKSGKITEFEEVQNNMMIKSGFYLINSNFRKIKNYLSEIKEYVVELYDVVDVRKMVDLFRKDFEKNKNKLIINYDNLVIDNIYNMNISGSNRIYQVVKKEPNKIHISVKNEEWNCKDLLVYVKNFDGETLYPLVRTTENEIIISFAVNQYKPILVYWI